MRAGTEGYRICVEREAAARHRGRMAANYAEARMAADAQEACLSYGLVRGSDRYDRCVQREIDLPPPGLMALKTTIRNGNAAALALRSPRRDPSS